MSKVKKPNPIYAYKGFVYRLDVDELIINKRYMENISSKEIVDLTGFGEISLADFRNIVNDHLNRELD